MPDLTALAAKWDRLYNAEVLGDPVLGYIVISVFRILLAWAAWLVLRALGRYLHAAFPPPHTPGNVAYWLRWWLWLRLRDYPLLKVGVAVTAVVLVLHIPAGEAGARNQLLWSNLLFSFGQFALLIGLTQFLGSQTRKIAHPL